MTAPRILILRAPGTNCDHETAHAFTLGGGRPERVHVNRLVESPRALDDFQILCLPGGFSFGDDLAAGRIFASLLRNQLGDALREFRDKDRLILGICNGFQVLMQTDLLLEPDPETGRRHATLAANQHGRFEDRWVHLRMTPGVCAFVRKDEVITLPIAHGEGNFLVESPSQLDVWEAEGRLAARYVDERGQPGGFPINPNGSMGNVAGLCDRTGRVFALMPHPERHVYPHQHPRWTRRPSQPAEGDGLSIFRHAVDYFR